MSYRDDSYNGENNNYYDNDQNSGAEDFSSAESAGNTDGTESTGSTYENGYTNADEPNPVHKYADGTYRSGSYAEQNGGNRESADYSSDRSGDANRYSSDYQNSYNQNGYNQNGYEQNGYNKDGNAGDHYSYEQSGQSAGPDVNSSADIEVIPPDPKQKQYKSKPQKTYKNKSGLNPFAKSVVCGIIVGVIAAAIVLGSMAVGKNMFGSSSSASVSTTSEALSSSDGSDSSESASSTSTSGTTGKYTVSEIADKCLSSVVAITCTSVEETQGMFGQIYSEESTSAGSGVIISQSDTELLIVTNYHVIEGSDTLTVCFNDSEDAVYSASQKGTDSENDLAVIAVSLDDMSDEVLNSIVIATIGDSTALSVGDQVVAIGNALGYGQSVTSGYVSALEREVTIDESTTTTLLQTDAAINPGNSGGALFNMDGELIGINSAKYSDTDVEGMGFAIPMSTAQPIIEELMNQETRDKLESGYGYLGIYGSDVDSTTSETYGIPEGVYISDVVEGGAAESAGLQSGDVITGFDGTTISSMSTLQEKLQYYEAGETVEVTIQRSNNGTYEEQTVEVTLGNSDDAETTSSSDSIDDSMMQDGTDGYDSYGSQGGTDGYDSDGSTDSFGSFFGY